MGRFRAAALVGAVFSLVLFPPPAARAEGETVQPGAAPMEEAVRIQYEAPRGCPSAEGFFLQVRARTRRVRLAHEGELASLVSVRIVDESGRRVGALEMPGDGTAPFSRRVEAATCDEVALALSLVLALAFDPDALTTFGSPPPRAIETPCPPLPAPPAPPPPPPVPSPVRYAVGLDVLGMNGFGPRFRPTFAPFLEAGARARTGVLRPRVRAVLLLALEDAVTVGDRQATLQLFSGRVEGCPVSLELHDDIDALPCLAADVGWIEAAGGQGVAPAKTESPLWVAFSLLLNLRFRVTDSLFVEALGGAGVPVNQYEFRLRGPDQRVHEVPPVFGQFGFGVGAHFQ